MSPVNRYFLNRVWPDYLDALRMYRRRASKRVYCQNHPDRVAAGKRQYRQRHPDRVAAGKRRYRKQHAADISVKKRAYKRAHRAEINARKRHRKRVSNALGGRSKSAPTLALLGCSVDQCRAHLERQFVDGMSWANRTKWHVDHIRPVASYNLSDPKQQRACFHYSNLQPLWARDNLIKGARY